MDLDFEFDDDKAKNFADFLKSKSEQLDSLYGDVSQLCDRIEEKYISEDSSIYLGRFRNNINKLKFENEDLHEGGIVLDKTTLLYNQQENKWAQKVLQLDTDKEVIQ